MMTKSLLAVCVLAMLVVATVGESAAVTSLKAKVEHGKHAAPCNKGAANHGPAPPRQFLDIRLPHVVDDYHPPVGGFNPSNIPSHEVDVAARKILREIQAAEAEAKANGDAPVATTTDGVLTTEEHKALKQLLLDSDILVRAAAKSLAENGPIEAAAVRKVAMSAVRKAAHLEQHAPAHAAPAHAAPAHAAPIKKLAAKAAAAAAPKAAAAAPKAAAAAAPAAPHVAAAAPVATNKAAVSSISKKGSVLRVGAAATNKAAVSSVSKKGSVLRVGAAAPVATNKAAVSSVSNKGSVLRVGAAAPVAANKAAVSSVSNKGAITRSL